jgi:hypothetical protein
MCQGGGYVVTVNLAAGIDTANLPIGEKPAQQLNTDSPAIFRV